MPAGDARLAETGDFDPRQLDPGAQGDVLHGGGEAGVGGGGDGFGELGEVGEVGAVERAAEQRVLQADQAVEQAVAVAPGCSVLGRLDLAFLQGEQAGEGDVMGRRGGGGFAGGGGLLGVAWHAEGAGGGGAAGASGGADARSILDRVGHGCLVAVVIAPAPNAGRHKLPGVFSGPAAVSCGLALACGLLYPECHRPSPATIAADHRGKRLTGCYPDAGRIAVPRLTLLLIALAMLGCALQAGAARGQVRIKDIADVEGIRENQLVGYGLVVGLNGTGDKLDSAVFTRQSLIGMLERLGVNTRDQESKLSTKNVAAVMVTASLPAFARPGSRIDVAVSALGDAKDLTGGTLLVTPLLAADGEVFAVAQGALATGAISARGTNASVTRGVPTSGRIANGATVEREVGYQLASKPQLRLGLRNPDLNTARRMAAAVNVAFGANVARANDPRTVSLDLGGRDVVEGLARVEDLRVEPDNAAVVVIDEASGTIVMGADVRVSTVAIAQGNLTIRVTDTPQVSQPGVLSNGTTTTVKKTDIAIDDSSDKKLGILKANVTLRDLVASLNALGVGPRDMISILQSIKAAGALQAELQVR